MHIKDANRPLVDEVISQIEELRSIRNLIVHGLAGVSALPANGAEAHINCMVGGWRAPTGDVKKITATELSHYIAAVDACLRGLGDPSRFNHRL